VLGLYIERLERHLNTTTYMNAFYFTQRTIARFFAVFAMVSLVGGMVPTQAFADNENNNQENNGGGNGHVESSRITICHFDDGKLKSVTVNVSSLTENGHYGHTKDIIPPTDNAGHPVTSKNWDAEGQAVYHSGSCDGVYVPPVADMCPNIQGSQATIPEGKELVNGQCADIVTPPELCLNDAANNYNQPAPCTFDETLAPTCTVVLVSDATDFVVEKQANAVPLSFIHTAWTASLGSAIWIWGDNPVVDPTVAETQTFQKKFGFVGTVATATLEIASDNDHSAVVNAHVAHVGGSTFGSPASYDVTSEIAQGNNELDIAVTNTPVGGSTPTNNPAGLKYRVTITGTPTTDADCLIPYTSTETNPDVLGCTNPDASNFNPKATKDDESCLPPSTGTLACSINVVSDASNLVNESGALVEDAQEGWVSSIVNSVAQWIWSTPLDASADPVNNESKTFVKTFNWNGPVTAATLKVTSDNTYSVKLNGVTVGGDTDEHNFTSVDTIDLSEATFVQGQNTLEITVTNLANGATVYYSNPAGLLYDLTVVGNAQTDCKQTSGGGEQDVTTYPIQGFVWNDDNTNEIWDGITTEEQGDEESPLAGWTVRITNGEQTFSTTTDAHGKYLFNVPAGTWTITEDVKSEWVRTTQESHVVTVPQVETVTFLDSVVNAIIPTAYAASVVLTHVYGDFNFGNDFQPAGGGGSVRYSGGNGGNGGSSSSQTPDGEVLGASDSKPVPEVLGAQVSAIPAGAPNAGAGGAAPFNLGFEPVAPVAFLRRTRVHG
jgi:hypothetical protein